MITVFVVLYQYDDINIVLQTTIKTSTEEIQYKIDIGFIDNNAEYILPCVVNVLSEDDVMLEFDISTNDVSMVYLFSYVNATCIHFIIILTLTVLQYYVYLYWVCLYSEEKLQTMQNNLKIKTQLNGVKIIDHNQFGHSNKYLLTR